MRSEVLTFSRDAREQHPYRSLYAAVLFQGFRDAVALVSSSDESADWADVTVRTGGRQGLQWDEGTPMRN